MRDNVVDRMHLPAYHDAPVAPAPQGDILGVAHPRHERNAPDPHDFVEPRSEARRSYWTRPAPG